MASICLQWEETDEHLNIAEEVQSNDGPLHDTAPHEQPRGHGSPQVIDKLDDLYSTDDFLEKLEQHALPADRPPQVTARGATVCS